MTLSPQDRLNARILIVDDQPGNVALLHELLHSVGYSQVFSTMDPTAVAALHREAPFDLILLDLQMPGMDGFQVMEALKAGAAALLASEARYRALTELATDRHWEQDGEGRFTQVSGPVLEMLGLQDSVLADGASPTASAGWNEAERQKLLARIAARSPFLNMVLNQSLPDGTTRQYRVSGTPMFDSRCTLTGIALFMGGETTPSRAVVQSAGKGYRLRAADIKEGFNRSGPVLHLLLRCTQALISSKAASASATPWSKKNTSACCHHAQRLEGVISLRAGASGGWRDDTPIDVYVNVN
jgi:PAS domain S-box-containing protein